MARSRRHLDRLAALRAAAVGNFAGRIAPARFGYEMPLGRTHDFLDVFSVLCHLLLREPGGGPVGSRTVAAHGWSARIACAFATSRFARSCVRAALSCALFSRRRFRA